MTSRIAGDFFSQDLQPTDGHVADFIVRLSFQVESLIREDFR